MVNFQLIFGTRSVKTHVEWSSCWNFRISGGDPRLKRTRLLSKKNAQLMPFEAMTFSDIGMVQS
jgi:hypothetical protein